MISDSLKERVEYLSNHFNEPECRKELKDIIHSCLTKKKTI